MARIMTARIHINASVAETFALLADVSREPTWNSDVKSVRQLTGGPPGVGSEWEGDYRGIGTMRIRLTEYDPQRRRLTYDTTGPRLDMLFRFDFSESAGGGTYADAHAELTPKGAMRLMGPLLVPMMRQTYSKRPAQIEAALGKTRERTKS